MKMHLQQFLKDYKSYLISTIVDIVNYTANVIDYKSYLISTIVDFIKATNIESLTINPI